MTIAPESPALAICRRGTFDRFAPIAVVCPQASCKSQPGSYCRSKSGYTVPFHKLRKLVVDGWSYEKRIAAVAELRERQDAVRAAAERARDELAADPVRSAELAASHRRQQAAWDATAVAL